MILGDDDLPNYLTLTRKVKPFKWQLAQTTFRNLGKSCGGGLIKNTNRHVLKLKVSGLIPSYR